jgi:hypothetical protein
MTNFQKVAAEFFLAARAGRGGGLLLLPFSLIFLALFWLVGMLANFVVKGIGSLLVTKREAREKGKA